VLLAEDETDVRLFPPLRAGWAKRGEQVRVPLSGRNALRVIFGALNLRIRCADPLMVLTSSRAYIGGHDGDAIEVGGASEGVEGERGHRAGLL
jgi:hypothetical protein